jgi:hypothetical protein
LNNADDEQKDKLIDDLGSIFDDDEEIIEPPQKMEDSIHRDGLKMKEELTKARNLIFSGIDQVKQLKAMVSETKQSLQEQKRLQYLENLYQNKILEDEEAEENCMKKLSFVDKKRRL